MRRCGWSWTDYLSLPDAYVEILLQQLSEEDAEAARQRRRRR